MYTLNIFVSLACMVEISEEGYESITYALITTSSNVVRPLSNVISFQLLTFFPSLVTQESIATDTFLVRQEFASLQMMVILLNLSSLLSTPLLPRQKNTNPEVVPEKAEYGMILQPQKTAKHKTGIQTGVTSSMNQNNRTFGS